MSIGGIANDGLRAISTGIDNVTNGLTKAISSGGVGVIPDALQVFGSAVKTTFDQVATQAGAALNVASPGHLEQPQEFAGKAGSSSSWLREVARAMGDAEMKVADNVKSLSDKVGQDLDQSKQTTAPKGTAKQGGSSPSIDVETQKLQRMIEKRSQMFDMLRQIIDKYNSTAKGMIQSLGR
jgi:hypothetical protein